MYTALNVFLYNLPEDMIKFVRLNKYITLESALNIVTEEVNFLTRFSPGVRMPNALVNCVDTLAQTVIQNTTDTEMAIKYQTPLKFIV